MSDHNITIPWYRSLRFKLVAAAITVEIIMLTVLLANSFRLLENAVESQTQSRLEALSPLLDASLAGRVFQRDHAEVASILDRLTSAQLTEIEYIAVFDQFGKTIASSGDFTTSALPEEDHSVTEALSDLRYDVKLPLTIIGTEVGNVCFGLSLVSMVATQDIILREGLLIAGAEILLSLVLLATGGYLITRHLHLLAEGSRNIARGDYSAQIVVSGRDEIAMLADAFNTMSLAIASNIKDLRTSEMRAQAIFNAVGEAIFIHDAATGVIIDVNERMCKMYHCSRDEAIGNDVATFSSGVPPYTFDGAQDKVSAAMSGAPQTFEWQAQSLNGRIFWTEVSLRQATIGDANRLIAVVRDINDRKEEEKKRRELEKELHQKQRLESIGLMAGGVAHDLNNILSGVVGYPELLLQNLPEESQLRKPIEIIMESGQRAATVVADLLTVARSAATTRETHNLNTLTQEYLNSPECLQLKLHHPLVACNKQITASQTTISCSPVHVKKCLMNLLTNAVEAVGPSGIVTISTRNKNVDTATGSELKIAAGAYAVVSVQDDGAGIAKEDLEHIFEPFYTKKVMGRSGTGLGLTVVWNTMEDHDGKVIVDSNSQGTCFQLYFPVVEDTEKPSVAGNNDQEVITGYGEHILVVDDEPHLRDIANQMLQSLGYKVDVVSSGKEAIQFVKDTKIDMLVLDMLMEPGINGRQTYEEILKLNPDQRAIVASGFSKSDDVKATIKLGANGFIKKPYTMNTLGLAIKEALSV
ncbi:MAG: response regulator [Thermodesulfobacteriota bacterium]|nr:response regulator [Thermodesulfobacteriota bacterium]